MEGTDNEYSCAYTYLAWASSNDWSVIFIICWRISPISCFLVSWSGVVGPPWFGSTGCIPYPWGIIPTWEVTGCIMRLCSSIIILAAASTNNRRALGTAAEQPLTPAELKHQICCFVAFRYENLPSPYSTTIRSPHTAVSHASYATLSTEH